MGIQRIQAGGVVAFLILVLSAHAAVSGEITITASNSGWYYDNGAHADYTQPNISTGVCVACLYSGESRSFYLFDLSSVAEQVVAARLRISTGDTRGAFGRFTSGDAFETYSLFDVTHDPATLPVGDPGNTALFDDLANGVLYGQYTLTSPLDLYIEISLTAEALANLNSAPGLFGIGGAITTLDGDLSRTQMAFGGTHLGSQVRELILTTMAVPAPSPLWLMVCGVLGIIWARGAICVARHA